MAASTQEMNETPRIIWFDSSQERAEARRGELKRFVNVFTDVTDCSDEEKTIHSIEFIIEDKVILITSGRCARMLLSRIIHLHQIDSVFIYCININSYQDLLHQFPIIIGILKDFTKLIKAIDEGISYIELQSDAFAILDQFHASTHDFDQQSAEFLWFVLAKEIIFGLPQRPNVKEEML